MIEDKEVKEVWYCLADVYFYVEDYKRKFKELKEWVHKLEAEKETPVSDYDLKSFADSIRHYTEHQSESASKLNEKIGYLEKDKRILNEKDRPVRDNILKFKDVAKEYNKAIQRSHYNTGLFDIRKMLRLHLENVEKEEKPVKKFLEIMNTLPKDQLKALNRYVKDKRRGKKELHDVDPIHMVVMIIIALIILFIIFYVMKGFFR